MTALVLLLLLIQSTALGVSPANTPLNSVAARSLGPSVMGGRVTAIAVVSNQPKVMYVGAASGGIWKTLNYGVTWKPIFDSQNVSSIGDLAVAPSNPNIVWAGTGEANARNSVAWGNGVYRSLDGGQTWECRGLRDTAHVGRVVIHPSNSDIVYVAALGRLWGPSEQRGVFKTTDGGRTWTQTAFIDENTGFVDLVMDPRAPETLYAAAYRCRRDAFAGGNPREQFSNRAGLYKTTDGGETWLKLTRGLPDRPIGRCGIAIYPKDPHILYAVVQSDRTDIRQVSGQEASAPGPAETGGVFRSVDGGLSWTKVNNLCPRPFYFGQIRVDPVDDRRVYVLGVALHVSDDSGATFARAGVGAVHSDHHALWIDPRNPAHLVLGSDGGVSVSHDAGATWRRFTNLSIAQLYAVATDMFRPYHVFAGFQDNGTWMAPSSSRRAGGISNGEWVRLLDGDGFRCQVDASNPNIVYGEGQYGRLERIELMTGETTRITPQPRKGSPAYRFNWCSPLLVSVHDPHALYFGGNHLFRSADRGMRWQVLGSDLTRGRPGPSSDFGHTLTAIAESPCSAAQLWAGSDDGRLSLSTNGGASWADVGKNLPTILADAWVTCIECSHFNQSTVFVTLDRHRHDDFRPYIFKSTDLGKTWQPFIAGLPENQPVHVVREDARDRRLVFAGTQLGLYGTLDGGMHWHAIRSGLPPVAVQDLAIHPRDRELVVATHGRGIYIVDISPLEDLQIHGSGQSAAKGKP
jgi:photosystem II stability/assembly factor-like uncharacterized protein